MSTGFCPADPGILIPQRCNSEKMAKLMNRNKIGFILLFVVVGIILLIGYHQKKALERNYQIATGRVYDVELTSKSPDIFVSFKYEVNGRIFDHNSSVPCSHSNCLPFLYSLLNNKTLPVVYQKNNPGNCLMIMSQKDAENFNISLTPDQNRLIMYIDSIVIAK